MPSVLATSLLGSCHRHRLGAEAISVSEEQNTLASLSGTLARLDPLAPPGALPHGLDEPDGTLTGVGPVVDAHDGLNGLGGLVGVVEGDTADIVVQHMGLDNTVEEMAADESELAINRGGSTTNKVPLVSSVVGERRIGVLQESDGN